MCVKVENISLSDLKEMMQDIVTSSERVMLVELSSVKSQVNATLEQATKTNGRVDSLEDDVLVLKQNILNDSKHRLTDCPQNKTIRTLEDSKLTQAVQQKLTNNAITKTSIIVGIIFTVVGGIIGLISFLL